MLRVLIVVLLLACGLGLMPDKAEAHASLLEASPEPGARMDVSPRYIELTFNEPIEAQVGSIQLVDSQSREVKLPRFQMDASMEQVKVELPVLTEGVYTVSYRIISADGHPVAGSYVFVVGNPPEAKDASAFDIHKQLGHTGHYGGVSTQLTTKEFYTYAVRVIYYAALLIATGYFIWMFLLGLRTGGWRQSSVPVPGTASAIARQVLEGAGGWLEKWALWVTRGLLIAVLIYVFNHSTTVMEGQPASDWLRLFTRTSVGLAWLGMLVLASIGFLVRKSGLLVGLLWALSLLGLEAWSGHAAAYDPKAASIALDYVHLLASAVWAGGLSLLLGLWLKERKEAGRFATLFSGAAWLSIGLLTLTGLMMTLLFIPRLDYLFYTGWGVLLIAKTVLVVLVIGVGFTLRLRVRRGELPSGMLLKADVVLMALIIVIVGLFTYISPLPQNERVHAHLMGDDMHITFRVLPNVPAGDNEIVLKVWLPEEIGAPKAVSLQLRSEDRPELGPIEIPLELYEDEDGDIFYDFVKASYRANGPFIPFAGRWLAEIRVRDANDDIYPHEERFRNY